MSEEIHRRAHKVLWSFVRSRVFRIFPAKQNKSFAPAFKVVSPSLALNCLLQLAFSPNQLLRPIAWHCDVPVFPALRFSARSSSILCSASLPPPAKRSDTVEAYLHGNARERHNSSSKIAVVIRFLRLVPFCLSDNSSINSSFNVHSFLAQTRVSWTKNHYLLSFGAVSAPVNGSAVFPILGALCMRLWTNNWISMNLSTKHCWWHGLSMTLLVFHNARLEDIRHGPFKATKWIDSTVDLISLTHPSTTFFH